MTQPSFDLKGKRVFVAGHGGMVGGALVRRLAEEDCEILTADRQELDLTRQADVEAWMLDRRPDAVFMAAAKVGGIHANNNYPADFLYLNLAIETSIVEAARRAETAKLLLLGSSCIYPRAADQPMREDALLTGPLEPTNEWYAVAKIAGIKLCQAYRRQHGCDFISAMPTNLYGPGDNFHPRNSHVPAALLRRFHEAKVADKPTETVWGTGTPLREFMHVDDAADACVFLMKHYSSEKHINIGTGQDMKISDFAAAVRRAVGFQGRLEFDTSKPDGAPRKLLDVSQLAKLGWRARMTLDEGLKHYYAWFLENQKHLRAA